MAETPLPSFRLLLDERAEGPWNMAVDEALLEGVAAPESPPVIRLYGFSPPTVSVGRFQPSRRVLDVEALKAK